VFVLGNSLGTRPQEVAMAIRAHRAWIMKASCWAVWSMIYPGWVVYWPWMVYSASMLYSVWMAMNADTPTVHTPMTAHRHSQ